MNQERCRTGRGRPKKVENDVTFMGFTQSSIHDTYFRVPAIWINVCATIDNLAELKVIQYVMRHTWGFRVYDSPKYITLDEFVHGRKYREGGHEDRMDFGTGLSKKAVIDGLERAIRHGFLVCTVDASDKARVKKYYALKLVEEEGVALPPDEDGFKTDGNDELSDGIENTLDEQHNDLDGNNNAIRRICSAPRTKERTGEYTLRTRGTRNASPRFHLQRGSMSQSRERPRAPVFIETLISDFSRVYGDEEHLRSNISQATTLYRQSQMREEQFVDALYAAIDVAKRACIKKLNPKGRPNRVPYFFTCLRQMITLKGTEASLEELAFEQENEPQAILSGVV